MINARTDGVVVRTFEVFGFYSKLENCDNELSETMAKALYNVEDLRLIDSPSLLEFMSTFSLPSIRRLELGACWLCVPDLKKFIVTHRKSIRSLHLEDTWLPIERLHYWGFSLCDSASETILTNIAGIREREILQELTINRGNTGRYQYREVF